MGWAVGYDDKWRRDIGYGVPAICDHPNCNAEIDRGLAHVCCSSEPYGGDDGCGLFFCGKHLLSHRSNKGKWGPFQCERCAAGEEPFDAKPDIARWTEWKMRHPSWAKWREENGHPEPANPLSEDADDITDEEIEAILAEALPSPEQQHGK